VPRRCRASRRRRVRQLDGVAVGILSVIAAAVAVLGLDDVLRDRPVTSSSVSVMVTPSMMSPYFT